jgi:hypothetical protein
MHFIGNTSTPDYWRDAKIFEIVFVIKHIRRIYGCYWLHESQSKRKENITPPHNNCMSTRWFMSYCKMSKIIYKLLWVLTEFSILWNERSSMWCAAYSSSLQLCVFFFIFIGVTAASLYWNFVSHARHLKKKNQKHSFLSYLVIYTYTWYRNTTIGH